MTTSQLDFHTDQMAALRRDFLAEWSTEETRLKLRWLKPKDIFWAEQSAWNLIVSLEMRKMK